MNDENRFGLTYMYKRYEMRDGKPFRADMSDETYDPTEVRMFHYTSERFDRPIRPGTSWCAVETTIPKLVHEATGIGHDECVWRIEWRFHLAEADALVTAEALRMGPTTSITAWEYKNRREIGQDQVTWHRMDGQR